MQILWKTTSRLPDQWMIQVTLSFLFCFVYKKNGKKRNPWLGNRGYGWCSCGKDDQDDFTSTNFWRGGNIRPLELQFTKMSVIWVWHDVWKFWKFPLKANKKVIKKEFYYGVTKIYVLGHYVNFKWYILTINRFRIGHITVIFRILKPHWRFFTKDLAVFRCWYMYQHLKNRTWSLMKKLQRPVPYPDFRL